MGALQRAIIVVDKINWVVGSGVCTLALPMVLALIYEVIARYFFNSPTIWSFEVTYMLWGTIFMVGAGYALLTQAHVRIDIVQQFLPVRGKAILDLVATVIVMAPVLYVVITIYSEVVHMSYVTQEVSAYTKWKPALWPFKLVLLIGWIFLAIQAFSEFMAAIYGLITGNAPKRGLTWRS